ncbi:MAG TPA: hypothetical protein VF720_15025 [Candidatus Eisenbacteria bacterium]
MKKRFKVVLGTGVALLSLALIGRATTPPLHPAAGGHDVPGRASFTAEIDPETGQLGVPKGVRPELSAEELNAVDTSDEGLVQVIHADGSASVDLQGRFCSLSMARVGADGKVHIACVDTPELAAKALDPAVPVANVNGEEK